MATPNDDPFNLKPAIREVPDFPKPGINFYDVSTLFLDNIAFRRAIAGLVPPYAGRQITKIASNEARGFVMGGAMAHLLDTGFVMLRKPGKLPGETVSKEYDLEYGADEVHMHEGAIVPGDRVLLHDDLIATGGTATASVELLREQGADVVGACFLVDLPFLGGAERIRQLGVPVHALVTYDSE